MTPSSNYTTSFSVQLSSILLSISMYLYTYVLIYIFFVYIYTNFVLMSITYKRSKYCYSYLDPICVSGTRPLPSPLVHSGTVLPGHRPLWRAPVGHFFAAAKALPKASIADLLKMQLNFCHDDDIFH
jgi:hypothetical protein